MPNNVKVINQSKTYFTLI